MCAVWVPLSLQKPGHVCRVGFPESAEAREGVISYPIELLPPLVIRYYKYNGVQSNQCLLIAGDYDPTSFLFSFFHLHQKRRQPACCRGDPRGGCLLHIFRCVREVKPSGPERVSQDSGLEERTQRGALPSQS